MTTLDELCGVLDNIGLPWTDTAWTRDDDATLPYITLVRHVGTSSGADDGTWCVVAEYDLELYTSERDYALEGAVAGALGAAGIYYDDGGVWPIPSEGMMEAVFTVTVREN